MVEEFTLHHSSVLSKLDVLSVSINQEMGQLWEQGRQETRLPEKLQEELSLLSQESTACKSELENLQKEYSTLVDQGHHQARDLLHVENPLDRKLGEL